MRVSPLDAQNYAEEFKLLTSGISGMEQYSSSSSSSSSEFSDHTDVSHLCVCYSWFVILDWLVPIFFRLRKCGALTKRSYQK